jgi:hypothetical protein
LTTSSPGSATVLPHNVAGESNYVRIQVLIDRVQDAAAGSSDALDRLLRSIDLRNR